jgi:hypothetical protein
VLGFIDLENAITTCPLGPIPVAPLFGVTETIVGGVVSVVAAVVKLLLKPVFVFPARSVTLFTDTPTVALPGKGVSGVNVTAAAFTAYVPATITLLARIVTVPVPTDSGFTVSLNVTTTLLPTGTFVFAFAGTTDNTVGLVVSATAELPVVKLLLKAATWFPARSVNPPTVTV